MKQKKSKLIAALSLTLFRIIQLRIPGVFTIQGF